VCIAIDSGAAALRAARGFAPMDAGGRQFRRARDERRDLDKGPNMTNITRKLAALVGIVFLATALGCASTAKQEGTGEYVDDTVITTKVKAAIFNEPTLKSAEINVETFKGVVQLSGFVNSAANESTAIQVARNVDGVKSVKNDMRLK
jgi:osmotically-inducible protein OsmY